MAYGARLESVLGASPRGFESPILRHQSGTVRFRIFLCLIYSRFSQPSPLPDFCPLPAHLVQAPALLPALLFLDDAAPRRACHHLSRTGYRTKRVGFVVTFRLFGAEKSVLKLVGANLKDGQNVLVLWRLFGLLVRENPH